MMDEKAHASQPSSEPRPTGGGAGWLAFWIIFFMVIGFGSVGFYVDHRLASLEERVMTQTSDASKQSESALQALQNTQREILGNRREAAAFAQKFSSTLENMSALLAETVNTFSEQTLQLTKAIEQKDQSQTEHLETAIAGLTHEIETTREVALQAKTRVESIDQQLAMVSGQLADMNQDIAQGFTTLTRISEEMNQAVAAHFAQQSESLHAQLAELKDASNRSLESVEQKLAALDQNFDQQRRTLTAFADQVSEKTEAAHNSLARRVDAVADTMQYEFTEQKGMTAALNDRLQQAQETAKILAQMDERFDSLLSDMEAGFVQGQEGQDAIRSDLAEFGYALYGQTDDLLVEVTALKEAGEDSTTQDHLRGMEGQLERLAQNMQLLQTELGVQLADAAQTAVERGMQNVQRYPDEKLSQAVVHLRTLGDEVRGLSDSVQSGIEDTRRKAAEWMKNPQSEAAQEAFETKLIEFTTLIQSTQTQVESIQQQISGLAAALTQNPTPDSTVGQPIGMAEPAAKGTP
ncbi:MAG: hypothetical protein JXR73_04080 [Candidatus Omnitrophica bacterium]|nr:hypothetical protein [Candidatus Omnitrophota bacterium]